MRRVGYGIVLLFSRTSCIPTPPADPPTPEGSKNPAGCPEDDPVHSAPCTKANLRCEWDHHVFKVTGVCDGRFWRIAERDRDCPDTAPQGRCGQFDGRCSYVADGSYPMKDNMKGMDSCMSECSCQNGLWECSSTCQCAGKATEDPVENSIERFNFTGACLHAGMFCGYLYKVGEESGLEGQQCITSYACNDDRWVRTDHCLCPVFIDPKRTPTYACREEGSRCSLPGVTPDGPTMSCRCVKESWSCN
jgi:hypothetical protein